jgi:hypothetical protein
MNDSWNVRAGQGSAAQGRAGQGKAKKISVGLSSV